MGKKLKIGKGRQDKYYHIAKQQGYRSRACFKLIQINKKYNFLSKANVVIDLCAAPGGWLQVCEKFCPYGAIKIGIDLDKIQPIPGCKTFQQDITTSECFSLLRGELKGKKADCVLNDGAPNVGANWNKDAYQQIELTLSALKLAVNFLRKGGNFITKVFRSTDYNALVYVMKKFFNKVEANKPLASRFASAEIFVCCMDFIAPDIIDEKLFDPKYIFKDTETDIQIMQLTNEVKSVDKILEKRRSRSGYADDAPMMLNKKLDFMTFLKAENPFPYFITHSEITQPDEEIVKAVKPPQFYDEYLADLKVLGKREIGALIKWRGQLRQKHKALQKELRKKSDEIDSEDIEEDDDFSQDHGKVSEDDDEDDFESDEEDEDEEEEEEEEKKNDNEEDMDEEELEQISKLQKKELNEQRKQKEKKNKQILNQGISTEFQGDLEDQELFSLAQHKNIKKLGYVEVEDEDGEMNNLKLKANQKIKMNQQDIENNLESLYENQKAKQSKSRQKNLEKMMAKGQIEIDEDKLQLEQLDDLDDNQRQTKRKQQQQLKKQQEEQELSQVSSKISKSHWFDQDIFKGLDQDISKLKENNMNEEDDDEINNPIQDDEDDSEEYDDDESIKGEILSQDDDEEEYETDEENEYDEDDIEEDDEENGSEDDFYVDKNLVKKRKLDEQKAQTIEIDPNEQFPGEKKGKNAYKLHVPKTEMELRREKLRRQHEKQEQKKSKNENVHELNQPMEIVPETKIDDFNVETLAETLALGKKMLRKRAREQIIEQSYNRYAFEDHDNLPVWFTEDEKRHTFKIDPVSKEEIQAEMERIRAINSKAPKKVIEAKIRKQKRLEKKMKRTNKQVSEIFEQEGVTEKMKIIQAKKLYEKSINQVKQGKKKKTVVTTNKGKSGKVNQTSKKVNYVDPRQRKDLRNQKKSKKKTVQSGNGGNKQSRSRQVKRRKRRTLKS